MRVEQIDTWPFSRSVAAAIAGVEESQVSNWLTRYNLFPEKKQGRGFHLSFKLTDIMLLAAVRTMVSAGFTPERAVEALRPYGGPYGSLLHDGTTLNGEKYTRYPGTFVLTQNLDGRWVGSDGPNKIVCLEIRAWPIFDELFPRFKSAILSRPGAADRGELSAAIAEFESRIEEIRKQRWD